MAFDFIDFSSAIEVQGIPLKLKMGINFGRVIAGVIGFHKPQFSLIGDTVNTASRYASNCPEGKFYISDTVYEIVKSADFKFLGKDVPV